MKLFLVAFLLGFLSCENISGPYYYRVLTLPDEAFRDEGVNLAKIIKQKLPEKYDRESYCVELSIVRYSPGKEIYSFSGSKEEGIIVSYGKVALEVLVRIKKREKTLKVFFLGSEAEDTHMVLVDIVHKLGKELGVAEQN